MCIFLTFLYIYTITHIHILSYINTYMYNICVHRLHIYRYIYICIFVCMYMYTYIYVIGYMIHIHVYLVIRFYVLGLCMQLDICNWILIVAFGLTLIHLTLCTKHHSFLVIALYCTFLLYEMSS
jgi:hypothetical protein